MKGLLIFLSGVAIGSGATFIFLRDRYRQYAQEEIDSVKEMYGEKKKEESVENKETASKSNSHVKSSLDIAKGVCAEEGYVNYRNANQEESPVISVIPPEEFGEDEEYDRITFSYYADGILTDDMDEPVDIPSTVGMAALNTFGEYEDDSVHVKNYMNKCYYEVLLDNRKYEDVFHR